MKALKVFWKVFAVLSSIFVVGFFSYNIWDDYVRTGFSESPGYEWIANKMPEYEDQDTEASPPENTSETRDIGAEIEAEMAEKENNSTVNETPNPEINKIDEESDPPLQEDAELDAEYTENKEITDEEESTNNEPTEDEDEEGQAMSTSMTKMANNTANCFNIVDGGMTCPKPEEILYIEAESGKATVYLKERKKFFVAHSLTALHNQLDQQYGFYKTKKYLINLQHLIAFIPKGQPNSSSRKIDLELIESKEIAIPYAHLNSLKAKYMQVRGVGIEE